MSKTITKSTLTLAAPKPAENPFGIGRLVINKGEGPRRVLLVTDQCAGASFGGVVVYTDTTPGWFEEVGESGNYQKAGFKPFEGTITIEQYRDTFMP